ncbi:alpha-L-rhamnosidase [Limimaricola variabilis]|uniref:alpha-L-rhamnosidase n=1 Tax=Limimaricola variabilis TaxID=1492771 RepID=A0ABR6HSK6_9RHOB|nr:alpha-L-rhamnosidase [Limimaricola variabilis]MBB3713541.1 alpha-L-rhamnosidase [Limimaricola variabilis]
MGIHETTIAAATARPGRDWSARMIAPLCDAGEGSRASYVAREFDWRAGAEAVLHVSAQGLYRAFVNGARVGADLLTPGWTCYDDRIAYQSYDIAALLRDGANRIEIWLADGWYRSPIMWRDKAIPNCWGDRIAAIAEIESAGEIVLRSDADWRAGLLPITASGIYHGEDYDARLEAREDSHGVEALGFDTGLLVAHETAPVHELFPLDPVESWHDAEGRAIHDFGQNCGGYVAIEVSGEAGAEVLVEHSEVLGPDRAFDNRNYRCARGAFRYTLRGGEAESYRPHFTFMGYRYARVTVTGRAEIKSIRSIPISSVPEAAGGVGTGVPAVDRLVLNTVWSQRANFIEIPTDCPQRDERLGWTGDAQVFAGTACWLADCESFLRKYLRDVMHDQRENGAVPHFSPDPTRLHPEGFHGDWAGSTGWGDAITVIPWQLYLHYGREDVLRECFPAMLKWVDYLWSLSDGPIIRPSSVWGGHGFSFGDWLQPVGDNRKPRPTIADDCAATLYHAISTDLVAKIAGLLGETEAQARYTARAEEIRLAFAREYVSATGRLAHNDQTSYALAFLHDMIPAEHREAAKGYFRRVVEEADHLIGTGFIGTPALLPALTRLGMADLAEKVFLNREVPGWLYQVEQGATTIWERWDAIGPDGTIYEPSMNSYNHYAYGAVCQWLFEDVAGVQPTEEAPGFDRVRLEPTVLPALGHVEMWHDCRHGRIEAGWRIEGDRVAYTVDLPDGCEGVIPAGRLADVTLDGRAAEIPEAGLRLPAGRHEIGFALPG